MIRFLLALIALTIGSVSKPAFAAPVFPDRAGRVVVDEAHIFSDAQNAALSARLSQYAATTQHQFVVVTVPSLQGEDVKGYGYKLLRHWGLGDAARDDGVILLLSTHPRKVRIEVGYGLEPVLTDALSAIILQGEVVPRLKAGDVTGGLLAGSEAIMTATADAVVNDEGDAAAVAIDPATLESDLAAVDAASFATAPTPAEADDTIEWTTVLGVFAGLAAVMGGLCFLAAYLGRRDRARGIVEPSQFSNAGSALFGSSMFSTSHSTGSSSSSSSSSDSGGGSAGGGGADSSW